MNGRDLLLILTHLYRKKGNPVLIEDAVEFISFRCRYGSPSKVRRMLTLATGNEMIAREADSIKAEFLYDKQVLSPNLVDILKDRLDVESDIEPMC
ncbi:MAG: hypothetical protein ACW98U_06315 [Candidatus Thorarchaeota archaeon]|jgi:hypothetical protein